MANLAQFDITGSVGGLSPATDAGFDMVHGETLTFALSDSASVVRDWSLEVNAAADEDSPAASKGAPELTLVGASSAQAVYATSPSADITSTAPSSGIHTYSVRSKVNGGLGPDGTPHPDYVFERIIAIRNHNGKRKILNGEAAQYEAESWSEAFNELIDDADAIGGVATSHAPQDVQELSSIADAGSANADVALTDGDGTYLVTSTVISTDESANEYKVAYSLVVELAGGVVTVEDGDAAPRVEIGGASMTTIAYSNESGALRTAVSNATGGGEDINSIVVTGWTYIPQPSAPTP